MYSISWYISNYLLSAPTLWFLLCIAGKLATTVESAQLPTIGNVSALSGSNATVAIIPTEKHNIFKKDKADPFANEQQVNGVVQLQQTRTEPIQKVDVANDVAQNPTIQQQKSEKSSNTPNQTSTAFQAERVVVISERPGPPAHTAVDTGTHGTADVIGKPTNNYDFPDAYKSSFYFFFGISTAALLLIVVRIYRMRLSRAERKYGVQGDRANQELTPLPMAIEDFNSDEDDHTLFEINSQHIRIL